MADEELEKSAAGTVTTETSLLDDILNETQMKPSDDGYEVARKGIHAFLAELLAPKNAQERVDKTFADAMIVAIDEKISRQVDEVLHHPDFQRLESAWRSLKFVVDRTNFRENIKVEMLNCSKADLQADFEDAPEIVKSGLYKIAYTAEYGQFGGKPIGAIFSNYEFGPGAQDVALLQSCAAVSAMAHAPFFAAAAPQFFGSNDFSKLPNVKDLKSLFEGPQYTKWESFRETEDARYIGLLMPRFLLRLPYSDENIVTKSFNYQESVAGEHNSYLWANATHAMATRIADSFAKYRWCPNIIGPQSGGTVDDLPLHRYTAMGETQTKIPTEVMISERREFELSEQGFIALTFRKDSDNAAFFSANSIQKPKTFGTSEEAKTAELNYRLSTQLPYIFVVSRIAHYIKVMQREQIGSYKTGSDLEKELNQWIGQFTANVDGASPLIRAKYPLRASSITVSEVGGNAGWYKVDIKVSPQFKYMGAFFTLGLVGKLDKA